MRENFLRDILSQYKVSVISLGCPRNRVDSEIILGEFGRLGCELTQFPEEGDIIIVNTCSFIEDARIESERVIKRIGKKDSQLLIVCGCLPQLVGSELFNFPQVDAIVGVSDIHKLPGVAADLVNGEEKVIQISPPSFLYDSRFPRLISTPLSYAYLKIAEGCSNHCSYCRIPILRGGYRSREVEDIVKEAYKLVELGVKEIILIAQDIINFGQDNGENLICSLLKELEKINGIYWIRLLYTHPGHFTDELISTVAESKRICKYIDLPLQHTDAQILKLMNRPSWKLGKELIHKLRERIPDVAIRTTFIVGFPGEEEHHFRKLLRDIEELEFDWVGAFTYSYERGTPAAEMNNQVAHEIKNERLNRLMELQRKITLKRNEERVGEEVEVIVDTGGCGHTEFQCPEIDGKTYFSEKYTQGEIFTGKIKKVLGDYDIEV